MENTRTHLTLTMLSLLRIAARHSCTQDDEEKARTAREFDEALTASVLQQEEPGHWLGQLVCMTALSWSTYAVRIAEIEGITVEELLTRHEMDALTEATDQ